MTHGEDLSSDMHQDSVVLTYLESVLMRRAAAANAGIPADKSDGAGGLGAGSGAEGPAPPAAAPSRGLPPPPRAARSVPAPNLNVNVNVKKARLLQSEDWQGAHKRRRVSAAGGPEPALQPTHSTLLASLLQSFSSSLQGRGAAPTPDSPTPSPELGGGRPGALLDARGGGGGGGGESSRSGSRNNSPAASASAPSPRLSCSARLKAVASMVGKGTLPAPGPGPGGPSSPKPSAACSQLALLLSSDCQLQQYSRARSLAPSASQRLAAIACKKQVGAATPPRERCQRSPASPASAAGTVSGSSGGSSLLMHLLNSPKLPATNGHMWGPPGQGGRTPPRGRRPLKEEGEGGDPCPRSTCTPMDLSTKPRVCDPNTLHPGSLEQMTESLLFSWNPAKAPGLRGPAAKVEQEEEEGGPDTKSHHKVTLLQLLLGHPDGTQGDGTPEPGGEAPRPASLGGRPALTEPFPTPAPVAETKPARSPHAARRPQPFPTPGEPLRKSRAQQEAAKARHSVEQPPAYTKQVFPTPPGGPAAPLPAADSRLSNFSFSASKLLHDLAHTGNLKSPEPSQVEAEAEARLCGPSPLDAKPPGPGPGPDLAQLLERRSVLQLLLRNPEKEQAQPARRMESPQSRAYAQAAADVVRVKVEAADRDCDAFANAQCPRAAPCGAADTVKLEMESPSPPAPAHSAPSGARGGVLSQLLLRHGASPPEAYPAGALESPPAGAGAARPHNPCPITRIRHLLPASPPERRDSHKKPGRTLNGHSFGPNGLSEPAAGTNGRAPEPGHRGYLKDAPGFNVLKQLLLSENGIKVLSQHRGLQNGAAARESNHRPPTSAAAAAAGHFYQLKVGGKESPAGAEPARYPGPARLPPPPRPAAHHEPPWLTKANPILYYMLQRSGGEAQAFGLADETETTAAAVGKDRRGQLLRAEAQGRAGPGWVKQEPEESLACFRPHPAQPPLTPGQILEKVAAIKREPD